MSLPLSIQEQLFAAGNELPDLLPDDDPMMIFSREFYPRFTDEEFEACYSPNGRPAISPRLLACVTLLQFREHLSDVEAAGALVRRLDWKIALHVPVYESRSFDPSTLCYFRRRLKENGKMRLLFDRTIEVAQSLGLIRKHTNQRVDATHVISHVNRISTTDLLFRAVRCVVEEVGKKAPEVYESQLPDYLKERYTNRFSSFGMGKEKREERMAEIVEDGRLVKALIESCLGDRVGEFVQLPIMETIFEENVAISEKSVDEKTMIAVTEVQTPKQSIFDPRDVSLHLGRKRKCSWVGSKCHIVETAEKGEVNFITDMIYQAANGHDLAVHDQIHRNNERMNLKPKKLFADCGYVSGESIKKYRDWGLELMGYLREPSSPRAKEFLPEAFEIDFENRAAICPAGQRSTHCRVRKEGKLRLFFDRQTCQRCRFFEPCVRVGSKKAQKRELTIGAYYPYLRERRIAQHTEAFRDEMRVRAQVEGTISEATRFHGLRHARYRGEDGHQLQFYLTGAALNVNRTARAIGRENKNAANIH